MSKIVGACVSQYHDDENEFELLIAFDDGREIGFSVSRNVAQGIASEFIGEVGEEPALTCPHIDAIIASGGVSDAVLSELSYIRDINSQLRYGTWVLKDSVEAKDAEIAKLRGSLEPFAKVAKYDIGHDEDNQELFKPMLQHNRAPRLTVGDLRTAFNAHGDKDDAL